MYRKHRKRGFKSLKHLIQMAMEQGLSKPFELGTTFRGNMFVKVYSYESLHLLPDGKLQVRYYSFNDLTYLDRGWECVSKQVVSLSEDLVVKFRLTRIVLKEHLCRFSAKDRVA